MEYSDFIRYGEDMKDPRDKIEGIVGPAMPDSFFQMAREIREDIERSLLFGQHGNFSASVETKIDI